MAGTIVLDDSKIASNSMNENELGILLIKKTAALIASGKPALVGPLYSYLARDYRTPAARQALVRRVREAMIKCIILNGIPIVMEAFAALAKVEQPEDQEHTFTRSATILLLLRSIAGR
jgi:hypothetical protein